MILMDRLPSGGKLAVFTVLLVWIRGVVGRGVVRLKVGLVTSGSVTLSPACRHLITVWDFRAEEWDEAEEFSWTVPTRI